jgi:YD repeat-containing protein
MLRRNKLMLGRIILATIAVQAAYAGATYSYDAAGHLTKIDFGNGSVITYTYDNGGNLITRSLPATSTAITIQTNPPGLQFSVDGTTAQTAPQTLSLAQGSHTIAVTATQAGGTGTQYVFTGWSDSGAASHSITVGATATMYTATFQLQYQLTLSASPAAGGTVTPASGAFYNAGTVVPITAAAGSGYSFTGWTANVAGTTSASTSVTMSGPQTVTATFATLAQLSWSTLTNQPPGGIGLCMLLTDGGVMCQNSQTSSTGAVTGLNTWYKLTPDSSGSYLNGTWSTLASLPSGYTPLYFASAVLADGRVVVIGGEYNGYDNMGNNVFALTNMGAIYDPKANAWTALNPPPSTGSPNHFQCMGDAPATVLADGRLIIGSKLYQDLAVLDPATLSWSIVSATGKIDGFNSEEGWILLPDGSVFTLDVKNAPSSERFFLTGPATGVWKSSGTSLQNLATSPSPPEQVPGCPPYTPPGEIGPTLLRPDGTVFAIGGDGFTGIYTPPAVQSPPSSAAGSWAQGPQVPMGLHVEDGPAAVLPNGHVLFGASPVDYEDGLEDFEFDGTNLTAVSAPANAPIDQTYFTSLLLLPSGQVMFTDFSTTVQLYTQAGSPAYQAAWAPTITSVPPTLNSGATYQISGTQFNGLSQGSAYGDEMQNATNYPLVRITNSSTGHVFYARTHNHSTMAVATGATPVSTNFDVPANIEVGASTIQVVANGIPSVPVTVTVLTPGAVTIQTNPPGLQFSVDGGFVQTAPQTLNLPQGAHIIAVPTTQAGVAGTQFVFTSWSDSGAASHSITVGPVAATYTATFQTQYQLTISASPAAGGTITPASGAYYNSGTVVSIAATANNGYSFTNWGGNVASPGSATTSVTMSGPQAITANFAAVSAGNPFIATGQNVTNGRDNRYQIVADTTGEISAPAAAFVVSSPGWAATIPGAAWIAPSADQSSDRLGCCNNTSDTYRTTFTVSGNPSTAALNLTIAADDYVDVLLNGNSVFTHPNTEMWFTPVTFSITSGFVSGTNTLDFVVTNSGGPTGLIVASPSLTITKTHSGNFTQGQMNATYTITVSNTAGSGTTNGTVTVSEVLPAGLSLASMAGTGWVCGTGDCTRSDALVGATSYPAITVTVNVALDAPSSVTNMATVSGGGSPSANASDITTIATGNQLLPDLVITSLTGPNTAIPGGQISVSATVLNQGTATAGSFLLEFYFSTTPNITTSAVDTTWGCTITGLAANASYDCSGPIGVPSSLTPGTWYLGAIADPTNQVAELNKNNNSRGADSGPVTIGGAIFFNGEAFLGSGVYYLQFPNGTLFGYYNLTNFPIFYHYDMGFESFIDGGNGAAYLYDFMSGHWWYTSASLFPYLYDFTLKTFIYYFPDTKNPGHYTTNPRYFSNLTTGKVFQM